MKVTQEFLSFHLGFPKPAEVYVAFHNSLPFFQLCVSQRLSCFDCFSKLHRDLLEQLTWGSHLCNFCRIFRIELFIQEPNSLTLRHTQKARALPKQSLGLFSWKHGDKGIFSCLCSTHKIRGTLQKIISYKNVLKTQHKRKA